MPINKETLNSKLFRVLSKYNPIPMDATGKVTPLEDEADVFKFTFTKDGKSYGDVFATVDDDRKVVLYYKDDVTQSPDSPTPGIGYDDSWWGFLKQIAQWWPREGFEGRILKDMDKLGNDMARRKHMKNKDQLGEGYYPMGKKASYSDAVPTVKIVIEHSRVIEEGEQRYRNINRIFLENQLGERYLLDTKKPGVARVYARHIAEGGKVNDDRWSHIQSLCEEYSKMAGFVRATRNGQFNESAQKLVNEGIAHYQSLRESLGRMTSKRGYNTYFESWTPALMENEGEETNLNELFVQETLDPRIESVMPILSRLHKKVAESTIDREISKLSEWADSLTEDDGMQSNNPVGIPEGEEMDEEVIGQPEVGHPGQAGQGSYSDAEHTAKTQHRLGSHTYTVTSEQDNDGDFYYFIYENGQKVFYGTEMDGDELDVHEDALGPKISSALIAEHKQATAHLYADEDADDYDDYDDLDEGVAEDLDANQKRVGQLGPTEKITKKNPLRGKLVGANENFINMVPQAVAEGQEDLDAILRLIKK